MAQILVRNLDEQTVTQLKLRAERAGRSLEAEVRAILQDETGRAIQRASAIQRLAEIRESFGDRAFSDSTELRHEGRR